MKISTLIFSLLLISFIALTGQVVRGQSVLNPTDTLVTFNPADTPTIPAYGAIHKWVRTQRLSWNTSGYKAYIYNGCQFRLYFPKTYNPTANDGKKYPMLVFDHGDGEAGTVYDNEYSLYHGGQIFANAVAAGIFDGYVLVMQTGGGFGPLNFTAQKYIIDYMITNNKLDPFRVMGNGLSGGGQGTWAFYVANPTYNAGIIPMSAVDISYTSSSIVNEVKFTPIWNIHGGLDGAPAPYTATQVANAMTAGGANYTDLNMTTQGHDTWDSTWSMPAFWPFLNNAYCSNPWTLFGQTQFCPGAPINVTVGLAAGFQAYQWRKNGTVISGATTNTINVTQVGTYDAQVERNGIWSDWSHTPVVIAIKTPTITPPISVAGSMSDVLPGADGKTSVSLQVPDSGYTSYTWKKVGSDSVIGTQRILSASQPGQYIVSVTQQFGCSSVYSPPFRVVNAAGPNAPSPATNLVANALSFTQIELDWARNPHPAYTESGFEIYRSLSSGGPYTFVGLMPADTVRFIDQGLKPNVKYYYVVRAIDTTAAAPVSNEASAITSSDKAPPTAPSNLKVVTTSQTSVTLAWNQATDNVSVTSYYIYVNGAKSYIVTAPDTTFVVGSLIPSQQYSFSVIAADGSGNVSAQSNQVSAASIFNGLTYNYYTTATAWSVLPDFTKLTPVSTGNMPNVSISNATQATNYGYVWQGYIHVPVAGTYTFATTSDDGSALWFNSYTATGTPTVNNGTAHGSTTVTSAALTLQPGVYPICIEYFQAGGGANMGVSWASAALFGDNNQHTIADSSFAGAYHADGTAPAMPTQIKATAIAYNKVNITWTDGSNNESGFEIYRSAGFGGTYAIVSTTGANVASFTDSTVQPSTTYYYKVQAINKYGSSGFDPASLGGISYSFYNNFTASNLLTLPTLTPVLTGLLPNVSLSPATSTTNYAFKFQGNLNIPATGSYTFYTSSDDGSDLYVGGFDSAHLVVKNDFLQGVTERSGVLTLTKGSYPLYVTYFQQGGGASLTASYQGPGITKRNIPDSAFANSSSMATTSALPAIPSVPFNVTGTALSTSKTGLSWQDSSATVTGYQVYRSVSDSAHFVLVTTVATGITAYADTALFPNSSYFYKIIATGVGGNSASSRIVLVKTLDNLPVITKLSDQQARYGITTVIPVSATHVGGGTLVFTGSNLPSFATLTDNGNGTGSVILTPAAADQNTYNNLLVIVTDAFGGADTTRFNLSVNNNYPPVMDSVASYTINEGDTLSIGLSAHDQNASDTLSFTAANLPGGSLLTPVSNGAATLLLHPGYAGAGVYTVQVTVHDNNGSSAVRTFVVTVKDKNPNTSIYAHVAYQDATALGLPWNPLLGTSTSNLLDSTGNTTRVGLNFSPSGWWTPLNGGATTGNNSGVYPDHVLQDYMWYGSLYGGPDVFNGQVTGLDTAQLYSLTFFASSIYNGFGDNGTSTYTVGSQTVTVYVQNNTRNTATISNIKPAADGTISFAMGKTSSTPLGYFNALVITQQFDDGAAPAGASLLTGQASAGKVSLSWQDSAYNATGYQVWRAPAATGVYSLLGTATGNGASSYVDSNITGHTQYYYTVRAYNAHGYSGYTDTAVITTLNRLPKITAIANVTLKNNQQQTVNVTTTDDATAQLTLTATNLPVFATFVDNGNGTGTISLAPTAGTVGVYPNVVVTVTDGLDSTASTSFTIAVTEPAVQSVYVNFTGGPSCPLPWNTLKAPPFAGTVMSNLLDDGNTPSGISATLPDGFNWFSNSGWVTGNGDGIYPVPVIQNFLFEPTTATRRIQISGLNNAKQYNFVFFNSQWDGTNGLTNFTINGQTVSLQADWNINKTVQLNAIRPVNGVVTIGVAKATGAANAYINSIVIQGYDTTAGLVLNPTDLRALSVTQTTVNLQWQDRSAIETGYEVWRASDSTGSYSRIASLPANTVTYKDTKLSRGANYYYMVRAVSNGHYSDYSSVLAETTYSDAIYIAVNNTPAASSPWNNLNSPGGVGTTWNNFVDSTGSATSVSMLQTSNFAGANSLGTVTGNNSGVYPDAVLKYQYVLFAGNLGGFQLSGLNLSRTYDITFFGGESYLSGNDNTAYVVNGDTVYLNAMNNTNATVTLYGLRPDNAGQLNIYSFSVGSAEAGWFNAMVINGYTPTARNAPAPPQTTGGSNNTVVTSTSPARLLQDQVQVVNADTVVSAYPNPFQQYFTLTVPGFSNNERVKVLVYDMSGKLVYAKEFDNLVQGNNYLRVEADRNFAQAGVYIVSVGYGDGRASKTFKLIKN